MVQSGLNISFNKMNKQLFKEVYVPRKAEKYILSPGEAIQDLNSNVTKLTESQRQLEMIHVHHLLEPFFLRHSKCTHSLTPLGPERKELCATTLNNTGIFSTVK